MNDNKNPARHYGESLKNSFTEKKFFLSVTQNLKAALPNVI